MDCSCFCVLTLIESPLFPTWRRNGREDPGGGGWRPDDRLHHHHLADWPWGDALLQVQVRDQLHGWDGGGDLRVAKVHLLHHGHVQVPPGPVQCPVCV